VSLETVFAPAQLFGYLAFLLGVSSFLQKRDLPFKLLMALQSLSYVIHFLLLGNTTAALSASMSSMRSGLSMYWGPLWLAWVFIGMTFGLGLWLAETWTNMLPVMASCTSTYALFRLRGIALRCLVLIGSSLWLANNIISGSIGGIMLEVTVISVNLFTIYRLLRDEGVSIRLLGRAPDNVDSSSGSSSSTRPSQERR
jgi:hypothetical protein